MKNILLFGTAYYPEYMPYERTVEDMQMMKQTGMNVVRIAESTWSTLEPVEGTFDFTFIEHVLDYAERVICKLVEYTAGHPAVIGYQVDNETKHYGNISDRIQELFKEHLIEKYETTDRLNRAFHLAYWSNSICDWDDFPDMRGCVNGGLAGEFEAFQRRMVTVFFASTFWTLLHVHFGQCCRCLHQPFGKRSNGTDVLELAFDT